LTSSVDTTLKRWNINTGLVTHEYKGHTATVQCFDTHKDILFSGSFDNTVKQWNRSTKECIRTIDLNDRVWTLKCHESSALVGTAGSDMLYMIESETGQVTSLKGHKHAVYGIDISPENNRITSASYDGSLRIWDLKVKNPCVKVLEDDNDYPLYCVQSNSEHKLVVGTAYHTAVRLWDIRMTRSINTIFVDRTRKSQGVVYSMCGDNSVLFVALSNSLYQIYFL